MSKRHFFLPFVAAVCAGSAAWASNPSKVSGDQLSVAGADEDPQGLGDPCSGVVTHNCNWPNPAGQCPHNAPYCVFETPTQKECTRVQTLHPCQNWAGCAVRVQVTCL